MAVDDEHERDLAQLPQRARPTATRTNDPSLPREVTAITRPLFTADESDEERDGEDNDGDLFDAPQPTTADAVLSEATEFDLKLPQLTAVSHGDDDDDEFDHGEERTVVSLVLPAHLRAPSHGRDDVGGGGSSEKDEFDEGAPTQFSIVPRGVVDDDEPPLPEARASRAVGATKPSSVLPGWQLVAIAVGAVVVLAVCVVVVAAIAFTPAAASTHES